jgi:choline kinase
MVTIIYPYRNREQFRISNSLDSLVRQSSKEFCVIFVDYGSDFEISNSIKELLQKYEFVQYVHSFHNNQPWSRSKAINIGLRFVETDYVFIADIDMIFHPQFIEVLESLKNPMTNVYFQVGYLDKEESQSVKIFEDYTILSKSIVQGQGLSLFSMKSLLKVNGFDEFFHFWGAEDEDVHSRLQNAGFHSRFYNTEILLLHQWHKSFESLAKDKLLLEPMISDIFSLNKQKLRFSQRNNTVKVNFENWGKIISKKEFEFLNSNIESMILLNKKHIINNFIDIVLPNTHSKILDVIFMEDVYQSTLKYKIKKFLGIKTQEYYTLKEINDLVLKTLVIYYQGCLFNYEINSNLKSIQLKIKK